MAAERPAVLELLRWASRTGRTRTRSASAGRPRTRSPRPAVRDVGAAVETVLAAARRQGDLHEEGLGAPPARHPDVRARREQAALPDLERARDIRRQIGDQRGETASQHNIDFIQGSAPWWHFGDGGSGGWLVALIGIGLVLIAAAVGGALALRDDDEGPTTTTGGLVGSRGCRRVARGRAGHPRGRGASGRRRPAAPEDLDPVVTEQDRRRRRRARLGGQPRRRPVGARPGRPRARRGRRDERLGERRPPR